MQATLLEGKTFAENIKQGIKKDLELISKSFPKPPTLVTIQAGDNPGSSIYVKSQIKVAQELGIGIVLKNFDDKVSENELIKYIETLNKDIDVHGIIIQMPLPKQIDPKKIINSINPEKDVEGMHPQNLGKVLLGDTLLAPCTAKACMILLEQAKIDLYGKEVVVVGHSDIVGKPLTLMLLNKFATTTTCHIGTSERGMLAEHVKNAEVLIVAVGKAGVVKGEWIKEGSVVIDVGINRCEGKIVGDVEFEKASLRAKLITPVPGGVGSLTVSILMRNVVNAFKIQRELS